MSVRVRFAPSPTGPLHIGGVRTALYNYLFAKKHDGSFILRIEDTDQGRYVEGAENYIIESLHWLGLQPDEGPVTGGDYGPYRQSERKAIYQEHIKTLLENGSAYYAFDTPEELEAMRQRLSEQGVHSPRYDLDTRRQMRNSLTLEQEEVTQLLENGYPYTVRLRIEKGPDVTFRDAIRGDVSFSAEELDDKVLMKADGMPTYHFANVVDDYLMKISHVIRGEEWLSSTGHHVLLYRAFGWENAMPVFAHLPLILKPTGKGKLSKRDGAKFGFPVFPITWEDPNEPYPGFRELGFLPAAVINFLAFLGWNPGTEDEIFSLEQLVGAFSVERISKGGARFDFDKAKWYNSQYIQSAGEEINDVVAEILLRNGVATSADRIATLVDLYRERVSTLEEFVPIARIYAHSPNEFDHTIIRKKWSPEFASHFTDLAQTIAREAPVSNTDFEDMIKSCITANNLKFGDTLQLLRTLTSGSPQGPDVFRMLELLGAGETASRISSGISEFARINAEEKNG